MLSNAAYCNSSPFAKSAAVVHIKPFSKRMQSFINLILDIEAIIEVELPLALYLNIV